MGTDEIKGWLGGYQGLKLEYDTWYERWARLDNEQYIPAMREGDGSKRNPGASDRMGNATLRRMDFEEQTADEINRIKSGMKSIETAINSLRDPMHRAILKQRYITGNGRYGLKPWADIALMLYARCDEVGLKRVRRIFNSAIAELVKREENRVEKGNI